MNVPDLNVLKQKGKDKSKAYYSIQTIRVCVRLFKTCSNVHTQNILALALTLFLCRRGPRMIGESSSDQIGFAIAERPMQTRRPRRRKMLLGMVTTQQRGGAFGGRIRCCEFARRALRRTCLLAHHRFYP